MICLTHHKMCRCVLMWAHPYYCVKIYFSCPFVSKILDSVYMFLCEGMMTSIQEAVIRERER